jgi:hypothetical protein
LENRRRGELGDDCPVAATGTWALVSRRVGLANTLACRLTGCGEKLQACSDGNGHEQSKVLIGGGNGGRGGALCPA